MVARMRTIISGKLGVGGPEDWSVSLYWTLLGGGATDDVGELQGLADNVYDAFATNTILMSWLGTGSTLSTVEAYSYGATGPAEIAATATGVIGGTGTIALPPQCTAVISLLTGQPGQSFRGRAYWPNLTKTVDSSLTLGSSPITALVTNFRDAVNDVSIGLFAPVELVVYSPTLDRVTPVTNVRAGSVCDTQRRRRDRLSEVYTTVSL